MEKLKSRRVLGDGMRHSNAISNRQRNERGAMSELEDRTVTTVSY